MNKKLPRRNFITRMTLAMSSAIAAPFIATYAAAKGKEDEITSQNMNPIKSIKPLGFNWDTLDPFLFCVHHEDAFPKGNDQMGPATGLDGRSLGDDFIIKDGFRMYHGKVVPGFPGHPHRGFETITVVRKGMVDHADSIGAAGRYGNGDVQWMTAGKGVQHSEMFPLISKEEENPMELFQIWLNLPARNKMVEPHFKMLWKEAIPNLIQEDQNKRKTTVEVIAGKLNDITAVSPPPNSWAAEATNEVAVWNIKMESNADWLLPAASKGVNRMLYFYEGSSLLVEDQKLEKYCAAELIGDIPVRLKSGDEPVSILILQGKPIGEQVVQYGPFVMNTKAEIQQAFNDYHATQFGGWPWPRYDQVHARNKGRFAQHADGQLEQPKG
jgi:redox-sensitive bicupin YhaK (pirin superfamily)